MTPMVESILKSIDILIDKKIQNLQFDKTIICSIRQVVDKGKGIY
jgi:hypothetical protein